ncbi:hypothetical protein N0V90_013307 [Kalmusia sp. IMI 367209]|nr:hypothetical protein N0V90_013307 [Kalmusia sp. IMI 367209]
MPSSTPSSVSRYRPAVLVLTGAAAAYTAWLLYTSFSSSPAEGLHRSNAVRRPNQRGRGREHAREVARTIARLHANEIPLGDVDFFGDPIELDTRNIISASALREIAHELQFDNNPDLVQTRIRQLYNTFLDRLLASYFPDRALTPAEIDAVSIVVSVGMELSGESPQTPKILYAFPNIRNSSDRLIVNQALNRHTVRLLSLNTDAPLPVDDLESIPPTEAGDWDEETEGDAGAQTLQRTLYHIAEDRARQEGVVHRGITCNVCDVKPIRGIRWHCANCADFDLCSDCEATNSHTKTHIFYKIRVPAPNLSISKQEPLYPGRPHMMNPSIDSKLKKRLISETRMEAEEMDALWDQFTCLATTSWTTDPNGLGWALDRRAFNHAFVPRYSTFKSAPNLIYDRVFAYFDTDHNTLIGFEEFVKGIDGLHATDTHVKLRIVFNGYDIDGDGYISRKDVLRVFRAHYAIENEATRNYLAESAEEMSVRGALEIIQSAQPLGSAFTQSAIEPEEPNWLLREKPSAEQVEAAKIPPIIENQSDTLDRASVITRTHPDQNDEDGTTLIADALRDRWARRQFYTDEEEGFTRPEGADDGPFTTSFDERPDGYQDEDADEDAPPTPELGRPRWSRSSSRVRFQDDVDVETRSNASTSSRPIGERWGGYEIPEPEKDLGKEVLYQITQQAFNELLDPLFKAGEDAAMAAFASRDERRAHVTEIDKILKTFNDQQALLKKILDMGVFAYANYVVKSFCESSILKVFQGRKNETLSREHLTVAVKSYFETAETGILPLAALSDDDWQPDEGKLWIMMLYRAQLRSELLHAVDTLATRNGWVTAATIAPPSPTGPLTPTAEQSYNENPMIERDPTLPQFRPNSLSDLAPMQPASPASDTSAEEKEDPNDRLFVPDTAEAGNSSADDVKLAVEVGTSPLNLKDLGITLSRPFPMTEPTSQPIMHILSINSTTYTLHDETRLLNHHPSFNASAPQHDETFHEALIYHAYEVADSHLRPVALARLEAVQREINERRGSGLVSFEEFERAAREGKMRFLEAWMDWVSF